MELCKDTKIIKYYNPLHNHYKFHNIYNRERRIIESEIPILHPMISYYTYTYLTSADKVKSKSLHCFGAL